MGGHVSRRHVGGRPANSGVILCSMFDPRTREYELLYIIPATFTDEEIGTVEGKIKSLLEKNGGSILSANRLGKFRFAYPIKHVRHGHYVLVRMNVDSQAVLAIDTALRISPEVLRHLLLKADDAGGTNFELVQFNEVNIDNKEDRPRRRTDGPDTRKKTDEIKSGVAALEGGLKEGDAVKDTADKMSDAELEKKIETALEDKT